MTEPLVPANVDLRDFHYMPLDVVRLRDSRIVSHASGEGFRCAVLLWCVAWHQVPAASLPDDDVLLAQYAGFGRSTKEWKKHRTEALHGWVQCDDGRWYHPVVAEKALEAWAQRLQQRWRTECARIKKAAQRSRTDAVYPTFEQWETHLLATGSELWTTCVVPLVVPGDNSPSVPGDIEDCPPSVPRETPSKGREGKGEDLKDQEQEHSDLRSGAEAPADPPGLPDPIWGTGLAFLLRKGIPDKPARSLLGKLRKHAGRHRYRGDPREAEADDVSEPAAWLMAAADRTRQRSNGKKPPGKTVAAMHILESLKSNSHVVDPERNQQRLPAPVLPEP